VVEGSRIRSRGCTLVPLVVLSVVACADSSTGPSDPEFPHIPPASELVASDEVRARYAEDAAQLALREVNAKLAPADRDVELPTEIVDGFYNALLHVHGLRHAARDSVASQFRIHTFPGYSTHELLVEVSLRTDWPAAWFSGERLTGNPEVDALVTAWDLRVSKVFSPAPANTYVILYSSRPLDMRALGSRFLEIDGVEAADASHFAGSGNDIEATVEPGLLRLAYSVGFGDCPAGCIKRHYWFFEIDEQGSVRYRGTNGDPIPSLATVEATAPVGSR
jgi:hypothetical protein